MYLSSFEAPNPEEAITDVLGKENLMANWCFQFPSLEYRVVLLSLNRDSVDLVGSFLI